MDLSAKRWEFVERRLEELAEIASLDQAPDLAPFVRLCRDSRMLKRLELGLRGHLLRATDKNEILGIIIEAVLFMGMVIGHELREIEELEGILGPQEDKA